MIGSLVPVMTVALAGVFLALAGLAMSVARVQRPPTRNGIAAAMDIGLLLVVIGLITAIFSLGVAAFDLLEV